MENQLQVFETDTSNSINSFQDSFRNLEFERSKYLEAIKQIVYDTKEYIKRTENFENKKLELSNQLIEYKSKAELFSSLSLKTLDGLERSNWTKALTNKNLHALQLNNESLRNEYETKLAYQRKTFEQAKKRIDECIETYRENPRLAPLFEAVYEIGEAENKLEDLTNEKLDHIGKKSLDHNQVDMEWKQVKQIIVEIASLYLEKEEQMNILGELENKEKEIMMRNNKFIMPAPFTPIRGIPASGAPFTPNRSAMETSNADKTRIDEEVSMMTPRLNFSFSPFLTSAKTSPKNDKVEAPSSKFISPEGPRTFLDNPTYNTKFPMAQFDFAIFKKNNQSQMNNFNNEPESLSRPFEQTRKEKELLNDFNNFEFNLNMGSVKLNCNNGMAGNKTVVEMTAIEKKYIEPQQKTFSFLDSFQKDHVQNEPNEQQFRPFDFFKN